MAKSRFIDFWMTVSGGQEPTEADVLREGFREGDVHKVLVQVAAILALREEGRNGEARDLARSRAEEWQAALDADPEWNTDAPEPEPVADDDAQALADQVPRQ